MFRRLRLFHGRVLLFLALFLARSALGAVVGPVARLPYRLGPVLLLAALRGRGFLLTVSDLARGNRRVLAALLTVASLIAALAAFLIASLASSLEAALIAALTAAAVSSYSLARQYRSTIEYGYQRALGELSEYISNLDITLHKGRYATSLSPIQGLSAKLWREASNAKTSLEQLPLDNIQMNGLNKFLSQVGNFSLALAHKASQGEEITQEETQNMEKLAQYAKDLNQQLTAMEAGLSAGQLTFGEVKEELDNQDLGSDFPTGIILQQQPKALEGAKTIPEDLAVENLIQLCKVSGLQKIGESGGNLPCYQFAGNNLTGNVSIAGGKVTYFINSRTIGEATLTVEEALEMGDESMRAANLGEFAYRYYSLNNGILTINYAAVQDGIILYPDLIKIGIAMDNGQMVTFDATGYLMNHTSRELPEPVLSEADLRGKLSPHLTPEGEGRLALIPTDRQTEVLCYEFTCTGDIPDEGTVPEQVLVYVNVETGMEEQILILMKDDLGVLAM